MRENRTCGSEGGEAQLNEPSLPLSPVNMGNRPHCDNGEVVAGNPSHCFTRCPRVGPCHLPRPSPIESHQD